MTKRHVIVSDLHCGHMVGLTPPQWQSQAGELSRIQGEMWAWYTRTLESLQPINILSCNGDAIDGKGTRSGGVELLTSDRLAQADMATECLKQANAKKVVMTYGTPYHVGTEGEDFERIIADRLDADISGHQWFDVNGVVFDLKHKVGSSGVPHGRHTAIARERLWNVLWSMRDYAPRSDIVIRSHVHYHAFSGDTEHLALTTPALQGPGSHYGVRQCSGIVDFGLVVFDITSKGEYTWKALTMPVRAGRPEAKRL